MGARRAPRRGWICNVERRMAAKTATAVKKVRELTEEEILKAPEKDYMNEAQLAFFKKKLLELRDQLLQNADDTGEHLRENEITTDPSDRATLEEEYTLELRTRDRERKLLKKVEKSLRMIDDGSYGWCEETGEPIGVPRLIARPTATLSLEAQERRERVQKLYGD
jgi:DnaK suppressor protein